MLSILNKIFSFLTGGLFDIKSLAKTIAKFACMALVISSLVYFFKDFSVDLSSIFQKAYHPIESAKEFKFGYLFCAIGLDTFLTDLFASVYVAVGVYFTSMISVISFRKLILLFKMCISS